MKNQDTYVEVDRSGQEIPRAVFDAVGASDALLRRSVALLFYAHLRLFLG